ncbi:MAG: AbrB/MazE/SpoVT family DNA-binding domain-containing protein [Anaerolineae bacterium]|nr:AbrB/MazE/SpoVT family DNA-binding domain-containing protein [Anaerolineae bacterium]
MKESFVIQAAYTVRVQERGQIALPKPVRKSLAINAGDALNLVQLDDILLLSVRPTMIPRLSREFMEIMQEEGVNLAELLQGMEEERQLIWQERPSEHQDCHF